MRSLLSVLLLILIAGSVRAGIPNPTPAPESPPVDSLPAGDPSVSLPTSIPELAPAPPEPTAIPELLAEPAPLPTLDPGPAELTVRVCIDLDADGRCGATEGIHGLPVVLFDVATGDTLAEGTTNERGTYRALVQITDGMELAAAAPALGLSSQVWDPRRGVVLLLADVPIIPTRLP